MRWLLMGLFVARAAFAESVAEPLEAMLRYPGASVVSIKDERQDGGGQEGSPLSRVALEYLETDDSPEQVLAYFRKAWRWNGRPVVASRLSKDEWALAAFDVRRGAQLALAVFRNGSGTAAFVSLAPLWPKGPRPPAPLDLEGKGAK
jgi:hypothetical protein